MQYTYWLNKHGTISCKHRSPLTGKSPNELVVMTETRKALTDLLATQTICEDLRKSIEAALRHRARHMAPFMPLNEEQRLGWLDEVSHLTCRDNMGESFTAGIDYPIRTHTILIKRLIVRKSLQGKPEEVLITGEELIVALDDDHERTHTFCHGEVPEDSRIFANHTLTPLIIHFHIPEAPDITQIYPATYEAHKLKLASY